VRFLVLGPLEVFDGERAIPIAALKHRALLGLLLLEANRVVSSDRLIDDLWAGRAPDTAQNTLHVYVSQVRKLLGKERVLTEQGGYRLRVDSGELDLERFQLLTEQGRKALAAGMPERASERIREALALWRGPAFADLGYEDFAVREADRLEELRLEAIEERIEADLALRRHAELCSELRRLVDEHPLRDRLRAQLMLALYRSGRQTDALAAYADVRDALFTTLGLEPSPELRELERSILNHDPALALPAPAHARIPIPPNRVVGRERELAETGELLQAGGRLLTVTGPPGVGKTRLALELARDLATEYADGAAFVDLAPLRDPAHVPSAIAGALELEVRRPQHLLEQVGAFLRDRELLLLLDNCEHLPEAAALFPKLLESAPRLKLLATSREPLRIEGETEYALGPLPALEALVLFAERAQEAKPDFLLTEENHQVVSEICRTLDALPLALELAAARVRLFSPEALLARLEVRLPVLTGGTRELPARQRTLRATLEWSYELLEQDEQLLFQAISVFAGTFDEEGAAAVCGATSARLPSLEDKGLLVRAGDRFRLLETIREFAAELLAGAANRDEIYARHARFFLGLAELAEPALRAGEDRYWIERLATEHENLRAVLRRSLVSGEAEIGARLAACLWRFWYGRGLFSEGLKWFADVLDSDGSLPAELRARVLMGAGALASQVGDFETAESRLGDALTLFQEAGEPLGVAQTELALGVQADMQGHEQQARALYERSLAAFRKLGEVAGTAEAANNFGVLLLLSGDLGQANALLDESASLYAELGNELGQMVASVNLAHVSLEQGNVEGALSRYRENLRQSLELRFKHGVDECLEGIASIATATQDYLRAVRLWGAAEELRRETETPLHPVLKRGYDRGVARARRDLGAAEFEAAWNEGRTMTLEQAVAEAAGREVPGKA
jgi:predicted ATPase/DNA-binding SARP family transcriptional activator